jgi:hypothetical protein
LPFLPFLPLSPLRFLGDPFFLLSAVLDFELWPFSEAAFFLWSPFAFLEAASSLSLDDFERLSMMEEEVSGHKRMKEVSSTMTSNWDVGDSVVVSSEIGNSVVGCSMLMLGDAGEGSAVGVDVGAGKVASIGEDVGTGEVASIGVDVGAAEVASIGEDVGAAEVASIGEDVGAAEVLLSAGAGVGPSVMDWVKKASTPLHSKLQLKLEQSLKINS